MNALPRFILLGSSFFGLTLAGGSNAYADWYLRGTNNGWAASKMNRVGDVVEATADFAADGEFEFDQFGDWSRLLGDDQADNSAELKGKAIAVSAGAGTYKISLHPGSGLYSAVKIVNAPGAYANPAPAPGILKVNNLDVVPGNAWLVFQRIHNKNVKPQWKNIKTHDNASLRLTNETGATVVIKKITITTLDKGYFALVNPAALPFNLASGAKYDIKIRMTPGVHPLEKNLLKSMLLIETSDAAKPSIFVTLAGFNMVAPEGGNEPSVAAIFKSFGYTTTLTYPGQNLTNRGKVQAVGQEVLSPFWEVADKTQPANIRQLTALHACCAYAAPISWYAKGGSQTRFIMRHDGQSGQSYLPLAHMSASPTAATFKPTGVFGFNIDGMWSDPAKNGNRHQIRFFPVKDHKGNSITNSWIIIMDYMSGNVGGNYDYNDNIYIVKNVRPSK